MGLIKTAAKAAVATRVAGNVHRRQQQRWAAQDAAAAQAAQAAQVAPAAPVTHAAQTPPPAAPSDPTQLIEQLTKLGQLRDAGVLTEAEFEVQKARILAG